MWVWAAAAVLCAVVGRAQEEPLPGDDIPASEEQLEQLEKMKHVLVCKSCEDMVESVEGRMEKRIKKGLSGQQREVLAIEILEDVCKNKTLKGEEILRCENAVDKLDSDDALTDYIKAGKKEEKFKEKACAPLCKWKSDLTSQISSMQENMIEKAKKEEIDKRIAQMKKEMQEKFENMSLSERVLDDLVHIYENIHEWWLFILLTMLGTLVSLTCLQVCCIISYERRKRRAELAKKKAK